MKGPAGGYGLALTGVVEPALRLGDRLDREGPDLGLGVEAENERTKEGQLGREERTAVLRLWRPPVGQPDPAVDRDSHGLEQGGALVAVQREADLDGISRLDDLEMGRGPGPGTERRDRKSTRLNSSHITISYAVFCLKKKKKKK